MATPKYKDEVRNPLREPHSRYQVSNYGRIRCGNNKPRNPEYNGVKTKQQNIVAKIRLKGTKKQVCIFISRAVYRLHIGEIPEGMEVIHIDGNRLNNHISNLVLGDDRDTNYYAYVNGLNEFIPPKNYTKIPKTIQKKIIFLNKKGLSQIKLSKKFGYSQGTISRIIRKKYIVPKA